MHLLIIGNITTGFTFYGPFLAETAALEFQQKHQEKCERLGLTGDDQWCVVNMIDPYTN